MPDVQLGAPATADDAWSRPVQAAKLTVLGDLVERDGGHLDPASLNQGGLYPTDLQKYGPDF